MSFSEFFAVELPVVRPSGTSDKPLCSACKLYKTCNTPKMSYTGKGRKGILILAEAPGCIGGDSLIEVAYRDKSKFPNGVPIKDLVGKTNFYVYSFSVKNQEIRLGKVKKVWKTGIKKVYKITYEWHFAKGRKKEVKRNSLIVTANHRLLLKKRIPHDPNGSKIKTDMTYLSIEEGLSIGHSIQPITRYFDEYGYCLVGDSYKTIRREGRYLLEQKLGRSLKRGEDCHHKNENKQDDREKNLKLHTTSSHARHHAFKTNPMHKTKTRKKHQKIMKSKQYRDNHSRTMLAFFKKKRLVDNHRIISIEYKGEQEVYDMEVEKYHNFATNGVFVHNSQEDEQGKQLVGNSGKQVESALRSLGVDMRRDCWLENSLACRPPGNKITNPKAVEYCRPHVIQTIKDLKPKVIVALGGVAMESLAGWLWKAKASQIGAVEPWVGQTIPAHEIGAWIVPTYHPSYLLRMKDQVLDRMYESHLKTALRLSRKEHPQPLFDLDKIVTICQSPAEAVHYIKLWTDSEHPVAFDYETNRLKPDGPGARIRCAGFSEGQNAVAFEFNSDKVTKAWTKWLLSSTPKFAHNQQFESRWSKAVFGVWPRNLLGCTMVTSHVLDGRKQTTGLKFQSFVQFGVKDYDSHIEQYLHGKGSYGNNRVFDAPARPLLQYCGSDAFLTWKLRKRQEQRLERF